MLKRVATTVVRLSSKQVRYVSTRPGDQVQHDRNLGFDCFV